MTKRLKLMKDGVKTNENYFKNLQKKKKKSLVFNFSIVFYGS